MEAIVSNKNKLLTTFTSDKENCKKHYIGELKIVLNEREYTLEYSKWTTWNGIAADGWSCKVNSNCTLSHKTKMGLVKQIINYKADNNNAAEKWYGQGRYMGD